MKSFISITTFLLVVIAMLAIALIIEIVPNKKIKPDYQQPELKTFASSIKDQLDSILRQPNENAPFKLDEAEVEVQFVVKTDSLNRGQIRYEIVTADTKSKYDKESIHKMNLHFKLPKR